MLIIHLIPGQQRTWQHLCKRRHVAPISILVFFARSCTHSFLVSEDAVCSKWLQVAIEKAKMLYKG